MLPLGLIYAVGELLTLRSVQKALENRPKCLLCRAPGPCTW